MTQTVVFAAKDWSKAKVVLEKISDLILDLNLYPRREIDNKTVDNYARALKAGYTFPNIKVGLLNGEKIIVDGAHRTRSHRRAKLEYITCAELPFESEAELFAEAVRCNADHGRAFTDEDLKLSIKRLQKFKFCVSDIVSLVHVPASEIYRETAVPIAVLTSPCGKKIHCKPSGSQPTGSQDLTTRKLIELKNALMLCCKLAESCKFPVDDPVIKDLTLRCRLSLGRVRFNA